MRKILYALLLIALLLSTNIALCKEANGTKLAKAGHKKHVKEKVNNDRVKRSYYDDGEKLFWADRGKKELGGRVNDVIQYDFDLEEPPFWGTRGRRDSSLSENALAMGYPTLPSNHKNLGKYCKHCYSSPDRIKEAVYSKDRRDEIISPFWGNRGRRNSDEVDDETHPSGPFWGNRGRRQDSDPFWGARGRRQEDDPFWGTRGRRDEEPFWGNRGRRDEIEPFWGTRGRREESEPFWGNRGRREESEPFWGNRGRREDTEPFWGNRGRRQESEPFWGARGRRTDNIKASLTDAISDVEDDIDNLSKLRQSNNPYKISFWDNRGRNSKLKSLFQQNKLKQHKGNTLESDKFNCDTKIKPSDASTILDDRVFAEQPHYILVERSSRSSAEYDPFFITRGKKKTKHIDIAKASRDRRGAIEEIVKSVRNDPYYIARGKKDSNDIKIGNSNASHEEFLKAKSLICTAVDLMMIKNEGSKEKRELNDNDRDRRAILKKLAAQLQIDPYYVSRGKKNDDTASEEYLEEFINEVAGMCN